MGKLILGESESESESEKTASPVSPSPSLPRGGERTATGTDALHLPSQTGTSRPVTSARTLYSKHQLCLLIHSSCSLRQYSPQFYKVIHDAIMPPKSPVTVARNLNGPGVLPVNPAALQTPPAKSSLRLKLEIRRLPPSLTKDEFQDAFGDEWRVGAGKIDWLEYRPGKVKRCARCVTLAGHTCLLP